MNSFSGICYLEKIVRLSYLKLFCSYLLFCIATSFLLSSSPAYAGLFSSDKDFQALHERFDLLESKVENLIQVSKKLGETALRNQANILPEINSLNKELSKIKGLAEDNYHNFSELLNNLTKLLENDFLKLTETNQTYFDLIQEAYNDQIEKFKEFNQAYFEQEKKSKEVFFNNFQLELEKIATKIGDITSIYKTSAQEELERDNKNIINFNKKMEEIGVLTNQLIQVYKNMATEQASREESRTSSFNNQLESVNEKISQLIDIYKQSISTITTSTGTNLSEFKKQLNSINSKIKQLAEIYKTSITASNASLKTISKNLSKELQSINKKLSKISAKRSSQKATPSKTKK